MINISFEIFFQYQHKLKKGKQIISMMRSIEKAFDLMGDDVVDLSTEKDALKNKIGTYDEKWLEKSKENLLKQIDDEKRANLIMSRKQKQMKKRKIYGLKVLQ